jgi:hypothetical protein
MSEAKSGSAFQLRHRSRISLTLNEDYAAAKL